MHKTIKQKQKCKTNWPDLHKIHTLLMIHLKYDSETLKNVTMCYQPTLVWLVM